MSLFITGFLQVFCVTIQTWFISQSFVLGVIIGGFLISFIWSFNVRRIAFGGMLDRIVYSTGASTGAVTGLLLATRIL